MSGYATYDIQKLRDIRSGKEKQPFPHQLEVFGTLSNTLSFPVTGYKGTMLVLPTGGGKTYTAVSWICRNILSKGIKVLWLAQSSYLLDQAEQTFRNEIHSINGRETINLRVVSSSQQHSNAGSILLSDDIIISTTQTAIRAYFTEADDARGNKRNTPFRLFIDQFSEEEFFVVVDEAHHTPAYGCRTLLASMKENMENLYVLGLTATPYHMDKRISGWLQKIYDQGICYQADLNVLQMNNILSVPKYIEKQTGIEFEVDDRLYDRLMRKHKDLPEDIIEKLANDSVRNNYIVSDYMNHSDEYGKTIIFADRWFQCEYIVEKLKSNPVENPANDMKTQVQQAFKQWVGAKHIPESHYRVSSRNLSFKIPLFDAFKEKLGETREKWWWDNGPFLFWMNMNPESLFFTLEVGPIEADKRVLLMESLKEKGIAFSKKGLTPEAKFNRIHSETISIKGLNDVELRNVFDRLYSNHDLQRILKILQEIYDTEVSSME